MAGHQVLVLGIGVRVPARQQNGAKRSFYAGRKPTAWLSSGRERRRHVASPPAGRQEKRATAEPGSRVLGLLEREARTKDLVTRDRVPARQHFFNTP